MTEKNKSIRNFPNLRFPEFEEEWKTFKLGNIMDFKVTNSFSRENLNYEKGEVKNIHYGDIHTKFQTLFDLQKEAVPYINEEISLNRISDDFYCQEGDVIFADASEDLNDVGKSIEIVNLNNEKLLSGLHTLLARPNKKYFHKGFNGYLLKSKNVRNQIKKEAQGSKVLSINVGRISNVELSFPCLIEQERITTLLSLLSQRIQTQNKIIKELNVIKTTATKKIFSRELLFKDSYGKSFVDWEEKKMKSLFSFKTTNSLSREYLNYQKGNVKNIHYGDIHTKFKTLLNIENEIVPFINCSVNISKIDKECYCNIGDVIFADASEDLNDVGKSIEIVNLNNQKLLAGLHTILARPANNIFSSGFCGYLFNSKWVRTQIQKESQGSKVLSISANRLSNISLYIPCLEEQNKIVNFLSSIDKKIDIEHLLLQKLEEQKKFLMQNMFK